MSVFLSSQHKKLVALAILVGVGLSLWKWRPEPVTERHSLLPLLAPIKKENPTESVPPVAPTWPNCFEQAPTLEDQTGLLEAMVPSELRRQAEEVIENIHLTTANGSELRLHRRGPELLLWALDREGYPQHEKFPPAIDGFSLEEKKAWFLRQGEIHLTEKIYELHGPTTHATWHERNRRVENLEASLNGHVLSCGEDLNSCHCKK